MMDCPRCGFSQPKDQFCANCGVNLEQFRPKPRPLYELWLANIYVLGLSGFVVVVAAFYFLNLQRGQDLSNKSNTITRDESFSEEQRIAAEQLAQQKDQQTKNQASEIHAKVQAIATSDDGVSLLPELDETSTATITTSLNSFTDKKMQIRFFEVSQKDLAKIFSSGKVIFETAQSRTVAVDQLTELEAVLQSARSLPGTKTSEIKSGEAIEVFFNNSDDKAGASWELNLDIQVGSWSGDTLSYQISGGFFISMPEKNSIPVEMTPEPHQLRTSGAIAIAGILPHTISVEPQIFDKLKSPVKILGSPDFRESLTEFVAVIQLK